MRRFKLLNGRGAEFDLMRKDAYLNAPDGLGFDYTNSYQSIGNVFLMLEETANQKVIAGEMVFKGYRQYQEFIQFTKYKPLKLGYKPLDEWLYINCDLTKLGKSEISYNTGYLHCPIDLTARSKWYLPTTVYKASNPVEQGKIYPYSYSYTYQGSRNGEFYITNTGTEDAPCKITIIGEAINPMWRVIVNDQTIASGSIKVTIPNGHKLVVCSMDGALEIAEYIAETDEFVKNRYQDCDFSLENFIRLPVGDCKLLIASEAMNEVNAYVEVNTIYESY